MVVLQTPPTNTPWGADELVRTEYTPAYLEDGWYVFKNAADRQTGNQTGKQANRQAGRQTDRQADIQTNTHTLTHLLTLTHTRSHSLTHQPLSALLCFRDRLNVVTNPGADDEAAAYAAGYTEGKITAGHIYNHAVNTFVYNTTLKPRLKQFINENNNFMQTQVHWPCCACVVREQVVLSQALVLLRAHFAFSLCCHSSSQIKAAKTLAPSDPEAVYWRQVSLVLQQLQGVADGYMSTSQGLCKLRESERDRETERDRERQRETERDRESVCE